MARKEYLEYCWNHLVKPQIGYSFSIPHDIAYSIEAVQEANLATRYNPLFWACACLCVNAGSSATDFEENIDQEDGEERPLDRYVRFRNNINEWYKEMDEAGLTPEEQQVLKEELLSKYGNSVEQEDMMRLVQRPEIANFTLGEANLLRKAVAKKDAKKIEKMKKRFFEAIDKEESE